MSALLLTACQDDRSPALARVDDLVITPVEFTPRLKEFIYNAGIEDNMRLRSEVLRSMIDEHLLAQYADSWPLQDDLAYQAALAYSRRKEVLDAWREGEIEARIVPTDEDIRAEFTRFNTRIRARHLYAATHEEAEVLRAKLLSGYSFESLAREVFRDVQLSATGGDLGYFSASEMDPALEDAAFSLTPGEISTPIRTADGYSILRVEDRISRPIVTVADELLNHDHVRRYLRWKQKELRKRAITSQVLREAGVRFNDEGMAVLLEIIRTRESTAGADSLLFTYDETLPSAAAEVLCVEFAGRRWAVNDLLFQFMQVKRKHMQLVGSVNQLKLLIEGLIGRELLYQQALRRGYGERPEARERLAIAEKVVKARFIEQAVYDTVSVAEAELQAAYEQGRASYYHPEMVRVQLLFHADSSIASAVAARARGGEDFTSLVMRHSMARGRDANQGIVEWAPRGRFGPLADVLFARSPGDIVGPVADSGGYMVIKLLGKRDRRNKSFAEARGEIEENLLVEKRQRELRRLISELRRKAEIETNFDALRRVSLKSAA